MKISVPDITCNHCVMSIQKALLTNGLNAQVILLEKAVIFDNEKEMEKIVETIKRAGYTPKI